MDEIISGVQMIKTYAWEIPFAKLIAFSRRMELKVVAKMSYIRAFHMTSTLFTTRLALFGTMLTIVLVYGPDRISADKVFVISSYLATTSHLMVVRFSRCIAETSEALVALDRLEDFMNLDEKRTQNDDKLKSKTGVSVALKNITAKWTMPSNAETEYGSWEKNGSRSEKEEHLHLTSTTGPATLKDLSIDFPTGKLIGVLGQVGAGKSSLLQVILRELAVESGTVNVNGSVSYACQEPWIFASSVRQNILFGLEYDANRYNAVVKTCALSIDLEQFEDGDRTIVGERGTSLSGGQKARIK